MSGHICSSPKCNHVFKNDEQRIFELWVEFSDKVLSPGNGPGSEFARIVSIIPLAAPILL